MKKTKAEANYREGSPMQLRDGGRKVTGGLIDLCFAPTWVASSMAPSTRA